MVLNSHFRQIYQGELPDREELASEVQTYLGTRHVFMMKGEKTSTISINR